MRVGILAVQGAFIEHERAMERLGIETVEIRQKKDLASIDGLILPGGESTVQGKLLGKLGMMDELRTMIVNGLPVLATCAGLILLAEKIEGYEHGYLSTMPISVVRNAYGRQLGSFECEGDFRGIGRIPMVFIRAPYIKEAGEGTEVLSEVDGRIVAARSGNQIALSFHPELTDSLEVHRYFASLM
ncbi:MAG: pyridoxal 5'-phosphate synthase glutaminase subunit PdxT [Candidatus Ornithospirochaeta sp.]|nr:pyridoxal 5'-phosphate synthase glutaminase subunit PdxT [Candidatus Ornithospirochaeta sp.]